MCLLLIGLRYCFIRETGEESLPSGVTLQGERRASGGNKEKRNERKASYLMEGKMLAAYWGTS